MRRYRLLIAAALLAAVTASDPRAQSRPYQIVRIADTVQVPTVASARCVSINAGGTVLFGGNSEIWLGGGGAPTPIAQPDGSSQPLLDSCPGLSDTGVVVFAQSAIGSGQTSLLLKNGASTIELGRSDATPAFQPAGLTSIHSISISGTSVMGATDGMLYVMPSATPVYSAPGGSPLSGSLAGSMNGTGVVAFRAARQVGGVNRAGLYRGSATPLVEEGSAGISTIASVAPAINDAGEIAFIEQRLDGTSHVLSTVDGLNFIGHSAASGAIALQPVSINSAGIVVFAASPSGGDPAIFTGPDAVRDRVVGPGDSLDGSTVVRVTLSHEAINDAGQISFSAELADGRIGIYRATPVSAPTTTSGALTTTMNTPVSGVLTGNDPAGLPLTYSIVTNGARGTATVTDPSSGAFLYVPGTNQLGADTFTFQVSNGVLSSTAAPISVTIGAGAGGNTAPTAQASGSTPATGVRLDAVGDVLSRATNLPASTSFTMMGWFRIMGDTTTYSSFLAFGTSTNGTNTFRMMRCCGNGWQELFVLDGMNGPLVGRLDSPKGGWHHIALTVEGTQVKAYINGMLRKTYTGPGNIPSQKFFIANDGRNQWLNGSVAAVKLYDVPLTEAEIAQEMQQFSPVRTANLNGFYPLQSAQTAANDFSGNDRPLTVGGTLTTDPVGPPLLAGTPLTTPEDTPFTGTLLATDIDGNPLAYSVVANGSKGTAVVTDASTGAFTYTPLPGVTGTDTFTFKASDGLLDSNVATITIVITPVNDPPTAADTTLTVTAGGSASGVLSATDPDSTSHMFSVVTNGSQGTATITNPATGAFTYSANAGASGSDTFTFRASDGTASSNTATVSVTILPSPVPVAQDGSLAVTEDTPATGQLAATVQNGDPLTYSIVANGTNGTATITNPATGAFTYTPHADASGADVVTFRASTASQSSNAAAVAITIAPVNDPPVASNEASSVAAGGSVSGVLNATDVDTQTRTFTILSGPGKGSVTLTNPATGVYTYTADPAATGVDTFTFKANDGAADSNIATATITITTSPNPVANDGSLSVNEDTPASGAFVATDPAGLPLTYTIVTNGSRGTAAITNASTGAFTYTPALNSSGADTVTFQASNGAHSSNTGTITIAVAAINDAPIATHSTLAVTAGSSGTGTLASTDVDGPTRTLTIVSNGTKGTATVTDAATGAYIYTAAANASGTDTFTFRANDGALDSNLATVTVTITSTNTPNTAPVAQAGGGTPATAVRLDAVGDSLSRATSLPASTSFTMMGWFRIMGDTTTYSSFFAFGTSTTGTNTFRLMRCCGNGWQDVFVLDGVNGPIVGTLNAPKGGWHHLAVTVDGTQVKAYINGALRLTYTGASNIPAQKFFIANDGRNQWLNGSVAAVKLYDVPLTETEVAHEMHQFSPVRTANLNGFYPLQTAETAANDFSGNDRSLSIAGTLATDVNGPPLQAGTALTTPEDTPFPGMLQATDAEGDPLTYTIVTNGTKGTAVVTDAATGAFTYTPQPGVTGTDTFSFKANDGLADSNVATITIVITPVNDPPLAVDGTLSVTAGGSATGTLVSTDPDSSSRTFALVTNGTQGTATITNAATGAFTYTANSGGSGTDSFTFRVSDGAALSNVATVAVTISNVPAPVASNGSISVVEDTPAGGTLSATDPGGAPLTYSIVTNAGKGTATITNASTGAFSYTPTANATGSDTFTFRANNGSAFSNTASMSVSITAVDDPPVAINGTASATAGSSVNGTLAATDVDSTSRTFMVVTNGALGTATVTNPSTGAYTYSANPGTSGTDTFTFRVTDGTTNSNLATVTVTITANTQVNRPPVALPSGGGPAASVRFDGASDELFRTTGLPAATSFTMMGWFKFVGDTNTYSAFLRLGHGSTSNGYNLLRCCGNGWRELFIWNGAGIRLIQRFTIDTWYHFAVTVAGSGPGQVKTYVNGVLALTSDGNPNVTADRLSIGNDAHNEWLNGNAASVKVYDVPLTQSEIAQEMQQFAPVRTSNLNSWYPLQSGATAATDFSGNNRTLTMGGTVTGDTVGPPITAGLATSRNTTLNGTVQATDPDGDTLTFSLGTPPTHGTAVVNSDGSFSYTPATGFVGTDTFTFVVTDGAASSSATVTITVNP